MPTIPEEIIIKAIRNEADKEELKLLHTWLREDKQHLALYFQLEEIWQTRKQLPEKTIREGWNRLQEEILARPQIPRRISVMWLRYVAAVFIGIVIASASWYVSKSSLFSTGQDLLVRHVVHNHNGTQAVALPDHSEVWLNERTKITYPEQFNNKQRLVELEGKAYFDIRQDLSKPFIVRLENVEVQVTGTEFFIQSHPREHAVVTLISGEVYIDVASENGKKISSTQLIPGQQADIDKNSGLLTITDVDTSYYIAWKNGTYRFTDEPLSVIASLLGKHYDLKIAISPGLKNKRFTGRVTTEHSIEDVMEIIQVSYPVKYHIEGNTIYITE